VIPDLLTESCQGRFAIISSERFCSRWRLGANNGDSARSSEQIFNHWRRLCAVVDVLGALGASRRSVMSDTSFPNNGTSVPRKAGRREWIGLAVIALPCLLYSMDLTVLNLAVPHISADLEPSATELLWIVDIYGFMIAGALLTMGTLGDRIGRRKLLLIGAVFFGLASILAAFSTSAEMLIMARALLGISAATLAPSTLSLISNMFPDPKERTFAIGVWISSFSAGGAIGPLIGGVLLTWFWWGSVFLIAVPVMILLLAVGPFLLPEYRDEKAGRIDLVSAALSLVAVLATIYGVKHFAVLGADWPALAAIVAGILIAAVFVVRQQKLVEPLIDLKIFSSRAFTTSLGINILGFFAAFGTFMLTAQYLQLVLGLSPLVAGLWTAPSSRFHRRFDGGARAGRQDAACLCHGRRLRRHRHRLPDAGAFRLACFALSAGGRLCRDLVRPRADLHAVDRPDRRLGPAGAGWRRLRSSRNKLRTRRGARHRRVGQRRRGTLCLHNDKHRLERPDRYGRSGCA
jgi:MFS family permease